MRCIIPIYNEAERIKDVLDAVTKCKKISGIICVDDASTDESVNTIKKYFPDVKIINHFKNQGKTAAILSGISVANSENILLLDADDVNLKALELDNAIDLFEKENLDCLLLTTVPMNFGYAFFRKIFPFCSYLTGDRIIKMKILLDLYKKYKFTGYQLETAENKYLVENRMKVAHTRLSAIDIGKTAKGGLLKGIVGEIKMWKEIFCYSGIWNFIKVSKAISILTINN